MKKTGLKVLRSVGPPYVLFNIHLHGFSSQYFCLAHSDRFMKKFSLHFSPNHIKIRQQSEKIGSENFCTLKIPRKRIESDFCEFDFSQ